MVKNFEIDTESIEDLDLDTKPENRLRKMADMYSALKLSFIPLNYGGIDLEPTLDENNKLVYKYDNKKPLSRLLPKDEKGVSTWEPYQRAHPTSENTAYWFGELNSSRYYERNIGIVLGAISDYVVVDSDSIEGEKWVSETLPKTPMMVKTAKGYHRYYKHPGFPLDTKIKIEVEGKKIDIDVKGDNSYVVAPPSVHVTGVVYEWINETWEDSEIPVFDAKWFPVPLENTFTPNLLEIPTDFPTGLEERKKILEKCWNSISKINAQTGDGGDKNTYKVACSIKNDFNIPDDLALAIFKKWNNSNASPPWKDKDLITKLKSAKRNSKGTPGSRIKSKGSKGDKLFAVQDAFINYLIDQKYVITPGNLIYKWDDKKKYYVSQELENIHTLLAKRMRAEKIITSASQIKSQTEAILWIVKEDTWKPEYEEQQQDYISFKNGIISRKAVLAGEQTEPKNNTEGIFCTYQLDVSWDPNISTSIVYEKIMPMFGDSEIESLQKLDEYGLFAKAVLLGDVSHQKLLYLYGAPGTGKSQLSDILQGLVPLQHRSAVGMDNLGADNAEYYLAELKNSLLNVGGEISKPSRRAIATIKKMTGGDEIQARPIRQEPVKFTSRANLLFFANEEMGRGGDYSGAVEDRVRVLTINKRIRDTKDAIPHFGKWFVKNHIDAFVTWAMSKNGIFGRSDIYQEENAKGIEEDEYKLFAQEHMINGVNFLATATKKFNELHTYKISERQLASRLTKIGWTAGKRCWNPLTSSPATPYTPPEGFYPDNIVEKNEVEISFEVF